MALSSGLKRKSSVQSSKKQSKKPSPSPSPGPEDIAVPSIYDDPMIDAPASSDSETQDDGDDQSDDQSADELGSDGGEGFDDMEDDQPAAGPSRPLAKHLYAPPTLSELDTLQSTAASGGTSFSLQLDALLASTLLPSAPQPALKAILSTLHSHILSLPSLPAVTPRKAVSRLSEEDIPWSGPAEFNPLKKSEDEVKWGLGWEKPEEVIVGGSWAVVGGYKKGKGVAGSVDLIVVMPSTLFSPKDRMSYRYFHKRTHYLAVIMASLRALARKGKDGLHGVDLDWGCTGGDARRSAIVLTAGKGQGLKYTTEIRIHLGVSPSTFPISSLQPTKSLLRHPSIPQDTATPLYSTSIVHDTLHKANLLHLHRLSTSLSIPRTVDQFLALWRIWAARRGISKDRGASGWFAAMILGWVVDGGDAAVKGDRAKTKRVKGLGRGLGSWQALRAAWEFLANTDFESNPVFLGSSGDEAIPRSEFIRSFQDVLVDPSGAVNVLAEWTKGEIALLRYHARETLSMLEDSSVDRFAEVFLKDLSAGPRGFDEFSIADISSTRISDVLSRAERPSHASLVASSVETILRQGLADRVKLVVVRPNNDSTLSIGLVFDPAHATRVLDVGPSSEKTEAGAAYEKLWGDKAELRRFKDGSIAHSVVWNITRPEEATLIPSRIISHLLQRHFNLDSDAIVSVTSDATWSSIIQMPASAREAMCVAGSEKLGFRPVMDAYDDLYKLLKSIDSDLPLAILSVQPASEMLRYSSTFVPHPVDIHRYSTSPDCLKYLPCAEIVLQFESSPRWPDDLAAVQKVKLAMFEKLARVVMSHKRGTKAGIVFDAARSEIEDSASLEVLTPGGIAFRVRIYHERERTLLERVLEGEQQTFGTALPQPPRRLAVPALELHIGRFIHQPQHHSALAPLHHRYPSYSSATRLLKRWFAAHMLGLLVSTEVTEIIMAKVYLDPGSLSPPSSAVNGFVRALDLLASWDWKSEPLYVPLFSLNSVEAGGRVRFPVEKREEAGKMFEESMKKDVEGKHAGWKVVTEDDLVGGRWTESVNALVAGRVRVLAKAAVESVKEGQDGLNVRALFSTPTRDYDVLIHLHPSLVTRYALAVDPDAEAWEAKLRYRNVQHGSVYGDEIRVGFEPVFTFVKDIQRLYGDSVIVFYDTHGGSVVGLVWNPTKSTPRALKPFLGYSSAPAPSEAALVTIDKTGVLGEIGRLGRGLIERIESR